MSSSRRRPASSTGCPASLQAGAPRLLTTHSARPDQARCQTVVTHAPDQLQQETWTYIHSAVASTGGCPLRSG